MSDLETFKMGSSEQKVVIEIPSDDSDDSDADLESTSDGEEDTTDVDKEPPDSSGASLAGSRLNSPPTTATVASPHATASQHSAIENCESDDADLKQVLKAARKAKAKSASAEQIAAVSAPDVPPPDLSVGLQQAFGNQIKGTFNFFSPSQPSRPVQPQAEAAPNDTTQDNINAASKQKTLSDPFAVHILNIEPFEAPDKTRSKRKRRLDKTHQRLGADSQSPDITPRQQVPGHVSGTVASQDTRGQIHEAPGPEGGSRRQSPQRNLPIQPRAGSFDIIDASPARRKRSFNQLAAPQYTVPTATPPTLDSRQPCRAAVEAGKSQRVVINVDEDDGKVCLPSTYPAVADSQRHVNKSNKDRNGSGSGISSTIRTPGTFYALQGANSDASQAQPDDLHGYIGGRPEKRPSYTRKETTSLDQAVKKAKRQQAEYKGVHKRNVLGKQRSRRSRPLSNQVTESRLLRAQTASAWREAPTPSKRTALQNGTRPSAIPSQRATRSPQQSLFRPNKNAYHQPILADDEDNGDHRVEISQSQSMFRPNPNAYHQVTPENEDEHGYEDDDPVALPPPCSAPASGSHAHRSSRLQTQPPLRSSRPLAPQPALGDNNGLAGPQRTDRAANTSNASRRVGQQVRGVPQGVAIPSRSQAPLAKVPEAPKVNWVQVKADMMAFTKQQENNRRTMIVDSLPAGFGIPEPREVSRAQEKLAKGRAKINDFSEAQTKKVEKGMKKRRSAISRDVRKLFPHESQQFQDEEAQRRFRQYFEKKKEALFDAAFLENGHDNDETQDRQDYFGIGAEKTTASEALKILGPNTSIYTYVVLVTKPYSEGKCPEFVRTKVFGQLKPARDYARSKLDDSRSKMEVFSEVQSEVKDGIFHGKGKLCSGRYKGKWIQVKMEKEAQMLSDLDDLDGRFVDAEAVKKFNAYDLFMSTTIPKCWRDTESKEPKKLVLHSRPSERKEESKTHAKATVVEREESPIGLEGDELIQALANLGPPATSQIDGDAENTRDEEEPASDTASQACDDGDLSDGTMRSVSPAGDSYDRTPRNPSAHVDHFPQILQSFSTLKAANQSAIKTALDAWKPRNADYNANIFWNERLLPSLQQLEADVERQEFCLEFPDFDSGRGLDHRPWGFVHSRIEVIWRTLQGPLDLPIDYVQDLADPASDRAKNVRETRAQSAAAVEPDGQDEGAEDVEMLDEDSPDRQPSEEHVELLDEEMPDRQSSDEGDISEEE